MFGSTNLQIIKGYKLILALNTTFIAISILFLFLKRTLPARIPLWYSKEWGPERLTPNFLLWLLPASSFLIVILNLFLAKKIFSTTAKEGNSILADILTWSTLFFTFSNFLSLMRILLIFSP